MEPPGVARGVVSYGRGKGGGASEKMEKWVAFPSIWPATSVTFPRAVIKVL